MIRAEQKLRGLVDARTTNALQHAQIYTIGDARQMTDAELLRIPNFGRISLERLKQVIWPGRLQELHLRAEVVVRPWSFRLEFQLLPEDRQKLIDILRRGDPAA